MACILSLSTSRYALQVSDRRPSCAGRDGDPALALGGPAHAPIIFTATDGALSIGYAGAAHVGGRPTDEWLAELLWGGKARRGLGVAGQAAAGGVSDAVYRIRRALGEPDGAPEGLQILVSGFRCKADRWLPVNLRVRRRSARPGRGLSRLRLGGRPQVVAAAVGSPPTLSEFAMALERIMSRPGGFMTADEGAAMLAGLVRTIAARDHGVGVDLMTTIIQPPAAGPVLCRFSSLHYASRIALRKSNVLSLAPPRLHPLGTAECSPWVISQQAVMGPLAFYGGSGPTVRTGSYTVMVESGRPEPMTAHAARARISLPRPSP